MLIYPRQNIAYIDALYLGMAACTQGGLNSRDLNALNSWQQAALYIAPMLTTPIFINTVLVLVRLHYFRREFRKKNVDIARLATLQSKYRRTITRDLPEAHGIALMAPAESDPRTATNTLANSRPERVHSVDLEAVGAAAAAAAARVPQPVHARAISFNDAVTASPGRSPSVPLRPILGPRRRSGTPILKRAVAPPRQPGSEPSAADIARSILHMQNTHTSLLPDTPTDREPVLVVGSLQDVEEEESPLYRPRARHHYDRDRDHRHDEDHEHRHNQQQQGDAYVPHGLVKRAAGGGGAHNGAARLRKTKNNDGNEGDGDGDGAAAGLRSVHTPSKSASSSPWSEKKRTATVSARELDLEELEEVTRAATYNGAAPRSLSVEPGRFFRRSRTVDDTGKPEKPREERFALPRRSSTAASDDAHALRPTMSTSYLSYQPNVQSNSVFVDLTREQYVELDGVEYRALVVLAYVLVAYYVGWHLIAVVLFTPWGARTGGPGPLLRSDGIGATWWGVFTAGASFNNLGLTLTPNSMLSFAHSLYVLLVCPFFMVIGNTGFPILLRATIWSLFRVVPAHGRLRESLGFLLDHPRRCFTLLFPAGPTWRLLGVIVALNAIDTLLFIALDFGAEALAALPPVYRVFAGLFQAVATRTTGFSIVDIGSLHPGVLVSYTVMMYINIFPVAMSVRHTNVYEEQTLGFYRVANRRRGREIADVSTHLMRQVSYDLWFIFGALFILCISEAHTVLDARPSLPGTPIPLFNLLFEVTSAYGTVGLSTGYPGTTTSLSASFSTLGKLVVVALLFRGRHRSLPYPTDRAVIVPSRKLRENDRAQVRMLHRQDSAAAAAEDEEEERDSDGSAGASPPSASSSSDEDAGLRRSSLDEDSDSDGDGGVRALRARHARHARPLPLRRNSDI